MKIIFKSFALLLLFKCFAQIASGEEETISRKMFTEYARFIFLYTDEKDDQKAYSLVVLDKIAREYLAEKKMMLPNDIVPNMRIDASGKRPTFAIVDYATGIGKPHWRVEISREGKVIRYHTGIAMDTVTVGKDNGVETKHSTNGMNKSP